MPGHLGTRGPGDGGTKALSHITKPHPPRRKKTLGPSHHPDLHILDPKYTNPDPWENLHAKYHLIVPRHYPIVVDGTKLQAQISRSFHGSAGLLATLKPEKPGVSETLNHNKGDITLGSEGCH